MKQCLGVITLLLISLFVFTGCALPSLTSRPALTPSPAAPPPTSTMPQSANPGEPPQASPNTLPQVPIHSSPVSSATLLESIYAQVNPSVVNILVLQKRQTASPGSSGTSPTPRQPQYSRGLGSGFVWDTEGHLVTNDHVVSGADQIFVMFYNGELFSASPVGTDPGSDLAVIKVNAPARLLQPVKMADSTQLKVGQMAIAIGNPFGLQGTMTVGIISGLGRHLPANMNSPGPTYSIPEIIQTDAAINSGNSGGVLLNDSGKVIGVTSAMATDSGVSGGLGFAIPSAIVQKVVPVLIKTGHYEHPWLGVSVVTMNPDLAKAMNLNLDQKGALVQRVIPDSPAARAGLLPSQYEVSIHGEQVAVGGDVIVAIDGRTVKSSDDLIVYIAQAGTVGETNILTIIRDGKENHIQVILAARPSS